MALTEMYSAKVGSPTTVITGNLTAGTDVIPVQDIAALTDAPGIATLLDSSGNQEVISYTGISGNDLTGVTRGFEGDSRSWPTGTFISRRLTAYDVNTANKNIEDLDETVTTHLAETMTEVVMGGRDATLTGVQTFTLTKNKKPKYFLVNAVVEGSYKYSSSISKELCIYAISSSAYRVNSGDEIGIANSEANRTFGKIENVSNSGIDIVWRHTGTGATGTIQILILAVYHGGV